MKNKIILFLILEIILAKIYTSGVSAATYYVSNSGSDGNSSSQAQSLSTPWKTVQKAANSVQSGDTVYVRGGTYPEQVSIVNSGNSSARITFSAYQSETPVIDGSSLSSIATDGLVQIKDNVNYITFTGFTVKKSPDMGIANRGSNNIISNNKILLSHGTAIWHRFGTNTSYINNEVYFNILMNATASSDTNITCNTVASWWDAALNSENSTGVIWDNNYIHDNCGEGIVAHGGDKVISNKFKDNWSINIYVDDGTNIIVDKNFIYETETTYLPIASGYGYKKNAAGVAIADELSPCATQNNTISNNILVNIRYGISFYQYTSCSGIKQTNIVNNTFVNYWDYGIRIMGTSAQNFESNISNNIFYSSRGKAMILENPTDFVVKNNLWYFAGGSSTGQFQWGSTVKDFSAWSTSVPTQINSNLWADPQFLSQIPTDPTQVTPSIFGLKSTSPAVNAGAAGSIFPNSDYFKTTRPQGSSNDIGAFELASGGATTYNASDQEPDGDVDYIDFNTLVSNFGLSGIVGWIRSDIIKDGVVNIFDFNKLITNFGL